MIDAIQALSRGRFGAAGLVFLAVSAAALTAAALGLLDPIALAITVGGALAVTRATFSAATLRASWARLQRALEAPASEEAEAERVIATFKRLARVHRVDGAPAVDRAVREEDDAFLRRAVQQSLECSRPEEIRESLFGEARVRASEGEQARSVLLTLGRLFPAFGLIGTLIGLVMVLRGLGGSASLDTIAPALGVTVLTTLYGAILANVVVLPLATKLQAHLARESVRNRLIIHGAELLHAREYPTRVERALRAMAGLPLVEESLGITVLHERAA